MNSSSPAHSSLSTTAVAGGGGGGSSTAAISVDDFHFPCDPISSQERKDEAMLGEFHSFYFICCDLHSKLKLCGNFTMGMNTIPC